MVVAIIVMTVAGILIAAYVRYYKSSCQGNYTNDLEAGKNLNIDKGKGGAN